jgi:hypothetical protein
VAVTRATTTLEGGLKFNGDKRKVIGEPRSLMMEEEDILALHRHVGSYLKSHQQQLSSLGNELDEDADEDASEALQEWISQHSKE